MHTCNTFSHSTRGSLLQSYALRFGVQGSPSSYRKHALHVYVEVVPSLFSCCMLGSPTLRTREYAPGACDGTKVEAAENIGAMTTQFGDRSRTHRRVAYTWTWQMHLANAVFSTVMASLSRHADTRPENRLCTMRQGLHCCQREKVWHCLAAMQNATMNYNIERIRCASESTTDCD